ncbi:uncharacterized protein LOC143281904 isoform X2 [Babylonia areolata]|uniref:uncharacterized protein LOC143281904 isoform X2 n=1 Tax=Babylonia areolata TaxID=304850 RepID=UPI003FD5098B
MGTFYNCLREVRLEKYYQAFRANGITCYESLANLSMPEICAMGISGADDRRRLAELVSIIKSVNSEDQSENNNGSGVGAGAVARKRQPGSPTPSSARSAMSATSSGSQSEKKVPRRRPRSPAEGSAMGGGGSGGPLPYPSPSPSPHPHHGMRLEPTRDVSVRERGPNFSVGSYLDMLEFMSDSSGHSDDARGDHHHQAESSDSDGGPLAPPAPRLQPPAPARNHPPPRKLASSDRVRSQARSKGYNYGVPSSSSSSSRDAVRSRGGRGGGGGGGGARISKEDRIRVCVRKRPLSRRESRAADPDIIEAGSTSTVIVKEQKVAVDLTAFTMKHEFVFDEVFNETCSNEDVYIRAARPLITTVFQRSNATFFAYGQTGAGKTHTMMGSSGVPGLYQLAAQDVFDIMASGQHGADLHLWVSFFEIYCGQLFDLLNRRTRLVAREDGAQRVCIAGLTETEVPDVQTLIRVLQFGNSVRSRGTSGVNPDSSRSHAVLQMEIRHADEAIVGKISFIDLAGSERASDMGDPDRQTRMEGAEINQSLLALKECIRSIDQESRHTPFRQSKLTHILKDAFVGNSRTCMIANLSPVQSACEHTLNTLRYADRVKELRRDSGPTAGGGASFGQAMNLLMNIPITAPSVFHPSNVLSTSTPVRPRLHDPPGPPTSSAAADIMLDPSETPIRGHNVFPKSTSKIRARAPAAESLAMPSKPRLSSGARTPSGAAASQGVAPPHPEASPSESDHTDTDSNNVTHPTETRAQPSVPNIPVIRSTDTDFDFPTSDFNNVDDHLNDLSQGGGSNLNQLGDKARRPKGSEGKGQSKGQGDEGWRVGGDQASAACASGPRSESGRGQSGERRASNPSPTPTTNQLSGRSTSRTPQPHRRTPSPAPKHTRSSQPTSHPHPPSSSAAAGRPVVSESGRVVSPVPSGGRTVSGPPTTDSFDDELLFGGPGDDRPTAAPQARAASSGGGPGGDGASSKTLSKLLPGLQTALSSDLASFSQRSPLRGGPPERTNPSPREPSQAGEPSPHPLSPSPRPLSPSPRPISPSSRREEGGGSARGVSPGRGPLAAPSCAAIKDWVAHKADPDQGPGARASRRRTERADPVSGPAGDNLPFAAYSVQDPSPRQPPAAAQDRLQGRNGSQTALTLMSEVVGDSAAPVFKSPTSHGLSGPSSDPVITPNTAVAASAHKDTSSSSLPTHSNLAGTKYDTPVDSHHRQLSSDSTTPVFPSSKTPSCSALVTEKLMSGAVFSPIHPQPVSTSGGQVALRGLAPTTTNNSSSTSSSIVHPTPLSVSASSAPLSASSAPFTLADREQARISLVGSHEDQLASITSLCKQEMKLLLSAKKAVPRSFEDYISRVNSILTQKMSAIQLLQDHIHHYQTRFSPHPPPAHTHAPIPTSVSVSAAGASSNDSPAAS